jgi:signal peptidase I
MQPDTNQPYYQNSTPVGQPPTPPPSSRGEGLRAIISTIGVVLAALLIAFGLTLFVFQSYQVDGPSMQPTLHNKDRLIIWKVARTTARITGNRYVPNRGDVIVFSEPGLIDSDGSTKQLIKRVIALPGERVKVKDGVVTVYNSENPRGFHPDQRLDYGKKIVQPWGQGREDVDELVGTDEVFVMGDNRDNSLDSRVFGAVPVNEIVGKLVLRIYPISQAERF